MKQHKITFQDCLHQPRVGPFARKCERWLRHAGCVIRYMQMMAWGDHPSAPERATAGLLYGWYKKRRNLRGNRQGRPKGEATGEWGPRLGTITPGIYGRKTKSGDIITGWERFTRASHLRITSLHSTWTGLTVITKMPFIRKKERNSLFTKKEDTFPP